MKGLFIFGGRNQLNSFQTSIVTPIGAFILFVLWYLCAKSGIISNKILPNPVDVIQAIPEMITQYNILGNAFYSIKMNLLSYVFAILIAVPLGFIIGLYPVNDILIGKYINTIRYLPIPAITGIFISLFGLTYLTKVSFLSFGLFIYILPAVVSKIHTLQNPSSSDHVYVQTINTLNANSWQKFKYLYFPYVMTEISQEIINLTAISWSYVVISELIYRSSSSVNGIGSMIYNLTRMGRIDAVYLCLFLVICIGLAQDFLLKKLDKLLFPHKYVK